MIGKLIKARRIDLGMTQEELVKKLGYKSRSTINKIELDINDVSQSKLVKIAKALDDKILTLQQEQERYEAEKRKEHSLKDIKQAIGDFDDILDSGDFSRIRATINALIEKIVVDDDITIYWMFD